MKVAPDVRGNSIAVNGNDVYIAGSSSGNGNNAIIAKYWKNGVPVNLSNGPESAFAQSVAVSGTEVYVAGYRDGGGSGIAQYWKNNTAVALTNGSQEALLRKIIVVTR